MSDSFSATIGGRLDRAPITAFHRRLWLAIGSGLFVDGIDVYLTSGVSAALVKQNVATLAQVAHLAVATAIGLMLGGLICGYLADHLGRRRVMQWTILIVVLGGLGAAGSDNLHQLLAWRFVTAAALGGETVLGYGTLSEFIPPASRGRWLAGLGLIANCGMPVSLLLGYFILPHAQGWRWMLAVPSVAAIVVFILRRRLPESPRWLAAQGRMNEAEATVLAVEAAAWRSLARSSTLARQSMDAGELHPCVPTQSRPQRLQPDRLFARGLRGKLAVGMAINIAIMCAVFGFVSWLPTFFVASGRDIASSALFAGLMSLGAPVGTLVGLLITDRIERKWGVVGASLLAALLGLIYSMMSAPWAIVVAGFLVVSTIYIFGTFGLVGYVPELFPTIVRMRAIGFCATIGRIAVIALPFWVVPLFRETGQSGVVALTGLVLLLEAAVVAVFGVPTKGRSLEDLS